MPFDEKHRAQQFLIKAQAKYGDLYDYSQVEYVKQNHSRQDWLFKAWCILLFAEKFSRYSEENRVSLL